MKSALTRLRSTDAVRNDGDALEVVLTSALDADARPPLTVAANGSRSDGMIIGQFADVGDDGQLIVTWSDGAEDRREAARTIVPLDRSRIGAEVVLAFPGGNLQQPLIMGVVVPAGVAAPNGFQPFHANVDSHRVELTAESEIVLRCGDASITLTRAGKIIIRGAYLLSRSLGVNRIKGGSVQIN